ncbi:MAG: hypothetical protein LBD45_01145, partial [Bacteroidales bacterium]|nr:hypothetical protein [Bacteroidales bacterium]
MKKRKHFFWKFLGILALLCGQTGVFAQATIGGGVTPVTTLDVIGDTAHVKGRAFRLIDGNQAAGRFLVSDADGMGTWTQTDIRFLIVQTQPPKFTFYENPSDNAPSGVVGGSVIQPLTVVASSSNPAPIQYQWYIITSKNIHAPLSRPCTTSDGWYPATASFIPTAIKKGDTRNANNTGMYRYFCRITDGNGAVIDSDIAEIAVGCGAKNLHGEWVSFMCFNLGASDNSTIASQRNYTLTGTANDVTTSQHTYIQGEENLYGDLFQWGRIADGHEKRLSPTLPVSAQNLANLTATIKNGNYCSGSDTQRRPWQQVDPNYGDGYAHFIMSNSSRNYNWHPGSSSVADMLWRPTGYEANDPCAHYLIGGTYHPFWNGVGDSEQQGGPACNPGAAQWRTPSQDEWASIYRGGMLRGTPANALANTWTWRQVNGS